MKFSELIAESSLKGKIKIEKDFEVKGLAYDSRKVEEGFIFFAIKGFKHDGNKFIKDAFDKGAKAILSEETGSASGGESGIYNAGEIRKLMAELSDIFYDYPSKKIKLIGVTGTNGKTTTTFLIKSILENAGHKVGLLGTIDYSVGNKVISSSLTTPESVDINSFLYEMVKSNTDFCVMEVSSIALVQDRTHMLNFVAAVFTNLTSEHLDFHETMENYFEAKKILFDSLNEGSFAVSNADDEYGKNILKDTNAEKIFYSIQNESDYKAENEKLSLHGLMFDLTIAGSIYSFRSTLTGKFNIYNILAAASTAASMGVELNTIQSSIENCSEVKGRFNKIDLPNGAIAIVDYSHTSDSLRNAIEAANEIVKESGLQSKVITVFGCGGNRDKSKRPVMGKFATTLSGHTIITSDNPRLEDPNEIINDILKGVEKNSSFEIIEDREEAIKKGITISEKGDIVLICGKGHETYQEINGERRHFDDKEMVKKYKALLKG